jgi:hypothetical protein
MKDHDIGADSAWARALADYPVPPLSAGFADRVIAAAAIRPTPLPPLRAGRRAMGWRMGRRMLIGVAAIGALASAAAATGLLQRFDLPVPSPAAVWASLTSTPAPVPAPALAPRLAAATPPPADTAEGAAPAPVMIDGPIDTPAELEEAFRRIDDVRQRRMAARRALADQRIADAAARRAAAGLPVPSPQEQARLREAIAQNQARRAALADERMAARRAELERKLESGAALTREDFAPRMPGAVTPTEPDRGAGGAGLQQWRQMTPADRRAALRRLPPEERRALMEQWRASRAGAGPGQAPVPDAVPDPEPPAEAPPEG